jgi:hypothetical protein
MKDTEKRGPTTVTITLTLKEAMAAYQYLRWAKDIEWMAEGSFPCLAKQQGGGKWLRPFFCVVDRSERTRPLPRAQAKSALKTAVDRALAKLHHILLGTPVVTPSPDGDNGEIHEYPHALVNPQELELYGDYAADAGRASRDKEEPRGGA